jgi:hypothetical protein
MLYFNIGKRVAILADRTMADAAVGGAAPHGWMLGTGHGIYLHTNTGFLRLVAQVFIGLYYVRATETAEHTKAMKDAKLAEVRTPCEARPRATTESMF